MSSDSPPTIRPASLSDIPTILTFIRAATAEQAPNAIVSATESSLASTLYLSNLSTESQSQTPRFAHPILLITPHGIPAGLAIYLYAYSTWAAKPGVCLEELYVLPDYRRRGYARLLIQAMAREAKKAGCARMEWICLEENEKALRFYEGVGARRMSGWVVLGVGGEGIRELAGES